MRKSFIFTFTVLVLLVSMGTLALAGGGSRKGTSGADELIVPVGARNTAMGGSFLSGITGVEAIYWNPAGLSASNSSAEAMFSHTNYLGSVGVDYFGLGANFAGFGSIGFTIKSLSFGDIKLTTERTPDGTEATYAPTYVTIGLTYSRALTDRIRAGVTANVVTERISRSSASGVAFDIGLQYQGLAGLRGLMMGVAIRHFGPNMKYEGSDMFRISQEQGSNRDPQLLKIETAGFQLPTTLEIGVAYQQTLAEMHAVTLAGTFQNNNFLDDQYKLGLEYSFRNFFYLRGGYMLAPEADTDVTDKSTFIQGASFGAGLKYESGDIKLGVDYSYNASEYFDGQHTIGLFVGF